MGMTYTRTTRDKSHLSIMHELQARGYTCIDLAMRGGGVPDILAANEFGNVLIEIKERDGGSVYISQLEFVSKWRGPVGFARDVSEAIQLINNPAKWLSENDKVKIAGIAYRYRAKSKDKNPRILVSTFDRLMGAK
jgi:hypothetical protein